LLQLRKIMTESFSDGSWTSNHGTSHKEFKKGESHRKGLLAKLPKES